jgi:hypothetical protein
MLICGCWGCRTISVTAPPGTRCHDAGRCWSVPSGLMMFTAHARFCPNEAFCQDDAAIMAPTRVVPVGPYQASRLGPWRRRRRRAQPSGVIAAVDRRDQLRRL